MSTIATAGASGFLGKLIVEESKKRGHELVEISRSKGVDLSTGEGLADALKKADAVIDASQVATPDAADPVQTIVDAAQTLTRVANDQGVERVVMLSINGVEKENLQEFPFYKARFKQEGVITKNAKLPVVVRSAQWFEFVLNPAGTEEADHEVRVQNWDIQPVATRSVARFLVEAAEGEHGEGVVTVAGAERITLPQLTEKVLAARDDSRKVVTVDPALEGLGDGSLHAPADAVILEPNIEQWVREQA